MLQALQRNSSTEVFMTLPALENPEGAITNAFEYFVLVARGQLLVAFSVVVIFNVIIIVVADDAVVVIQIGCGVCVVYQSCFRESKCAHGMKFEKDFLTIFCSCLENYTSAHTHAYMYTYMPVYMCMFMSPHIYPLFLLCFRVFLSQIFFEIVY